MSPRAAWRLESLGFGEVYDYTAGKSDWAAAGLPTEGKSTEIPRIGDVCRKGVVTCSLDERVGDVAGRTRSAGWDTCLVVNGAGVVFGRLHRKELDGDPAARVEDVMRPGPSTFRPNVGAPEMLAHMEKHDLRTAIVTTSGGVLVGLLLREDAEEAVHQWHRTHHESH